MMSFLKQGILRCLLTVFILVGCSITPAPTNPLLSATLPRSETPSAQTPSVPPVTPTASPLPQSTILGTTRTSMPLTPSATPEGTPTATAIPAPITAVKEENGWVTYRNNPIGYEISIPNNYQIKRGYYPEVGWIGHGLLGPAVPDEEISRLLARFYGDSLNIWMGEPDTSGEFKPWTIGIYAYDILVKKLGADVSPGGMGDYQLTTRHETLQIDWHAYPVYFTVEQRDNQPVGELAVLYLEKDGIEFMFGYVQPKDDPEAYQTYLKEVWPEIRKIVETYKKLPEKTSLSSAPSVNASGLKDTSPQAIAQALFEQYLTAYQENPLDPQAKLSAYRIDEVDIPAKWQACAELNKAELVAKITYAVRPAIWPPLPPWDSAGYSTFDHWIARISASIAVFRSGQDYTMKILDNPVCPGF